MKFSLGFRLLEGLVFAPFTAMVGQVLRGQVVVDSTALIGFFLSPRGFTAAIISATIFLTLRFMENAGLSVLVAGQSMGARPTARAAFLHVVARSASIAQGTFIILGAGLVLLTPLALLSGFLARRLLSQHDINFYLHAKPPEFIHSAMILGVMALVTVLIGVWLAIRCRWVAQVLMFESTAVLPAFRRSAALAQPQWLSIAGWWIVVGIANLVLGIGAAWSGRIILPLALGILGKGALSIGFVFGALWVLQALVASLFTMAGSVLEAQIFTRKFLRTTDMPVDLSEHKVFSSEARASKRWWLPLTVKSCLVLIGGVMGAIWGGSALYTERPMLVIAHRASIVAPENTVPAIMQSIEDGADVAEIDVQLSKDGVMVMAHDSDFSRAGGVAKRVSNLTWKEIQAIDVSHDFPTKFHGTRPARLEEILVASKGRIRLNIEIKHYGPVDGILEEKVVRLLEKEKMLDQIEIQALEFESIEHVRRLNPKIEIGYLMSVNARHPEDLDVNFLSVQMSRVDARFLRKARKQGQKVYVWTVNDEKQMEKALALGVDGLITDQSSMAVGFIKRWTALSPNEKALQRLNYWLAQ